MNARGGRLLGRWLLATGGAYALGAVDYVARPRAAVALLNRAGGDPVPFEEPPGIYNALAGAYMATIAALSIRAGLDPQPNREVVSALLIGKGASAAALLYRFVSTGRRGFAVAAALDAVLLGVTAGLAADA